eukprot:Hpha_TRINITY_DN8160_c0_g1::TRINITY_DN8160_c0_g1_i1::g.172101::m.172101
MRSACNNPLQGSQGVLKNHAIALADVGLSNQATLELIESMTIIFKEGRRVEQSGRPIALTAGATLAELQKESGSPALKHMKYFLRKPDMQPRPLSPWAPKWSEKAVVLESKVKLHDQGVEDGSEIVAYIDDPQKHRYRGRAYEPQVSVPLEVPVDAGSTEALRMGEVQQRAASLYLEQAGEEQTSVASFAALTLRLMAVGAPHALLDASLRAGRDEVKHARQCLRLAEALGGLQQAALHQLPAHTLTVDGGMAGLARNSVR